MDSKLMERYRLRYLQNAIKAQQQLRATQRLFQLFEEEKIDYLPVKGCVLKMLYPQPDLRIMADADILIRPEQHPRLKAGMEKLGFRFEGENDHVFEWRSEELFVELHKSLVPLSDPEYFAYYSDIWKKARKGEGFRWELSPEDTFVFVFVHFARHYRSSGIGCQHALDLWVYKRSAPQLDYTRVRRELRKLRLEAFYENTMQLLDVWFEGKAGDEITELMTAFIFSGGRWGTMEAELLLKEVRRSEVSGTIRHTGIKSFFRALFPGRQDLTYNYPILLKHPNLLPVFWIVRWVHIGLTDPGKILRKWKTVRAISDERVTDHRKLLQAVGLGFGGPGNIYTEKDKIQLKIFTENGKILGDKVSCGSCANAPRKNLGFFTFFLKKVNDALNPSPASGRMEGAEQTHERKNLERNGNNHGKKL